MIFVAEHEISSCCGIIVFHGVVIFIAFKGQLNLKFKCQQI